MSIIPPGIGRLLQFYLSGPLPCPYLPGQIERKLFTRLAGDASDAEVNAMLTRAGFRRSHDVAYRPACEACDACIPVRVPVRAFTPSRSLKRVAALNRDLTLEIADVRAAAEEQYGIFMAYQRARHPDSEMARMTRFEFDAMLREGASDTHLYQLRTPAGALAGGMIADRTGDGVSAVYSFFAPGEARRSLGAHLILTLIGEMKRENLPHVYLGYWIAGARKMAYKARFRPLQALGPGGWDWLEPDGENKG
jgi:leucyl-tRNA---protein transferase